MITTLGLLDVLNVYSGRQWSRKRKQHMQRPGGIHIMVHLGKYWEQVVSARAEAALSTVMVMSPRWY